MATHLFNAMPPLITVGPGLVGAAWARRGAGPDRRMASTSIRWSSTWSQSQPDPSESPFVSRCSGAAGTPPGACLLGNQSRDFRRPRGADADGTLAGCARLLDEDLRNVRTWLPSMDPPNSSTCYSTPANLLGLRRKGRCRRLGTRT